jgi:hypothetical protein
MDFKQLTIQCIQSWRHKQTSPGSKNFQGRKIIDHVIINLVHTSLLQLSSYQFGPSITWTKWNFSQSSRYPLVLDSS